MYARDITRRFEKTDGGIVMKAPDVIYVEFSEDVNLAFEKQPFEETPTYIRKEALLEWAKNLKERWEEPPMSKHSPGCVYMLEQLINKLSSM